MFYGDIYPNNECFDEEIGSKLRQLILDRRKFAYGPQRDYFLERNCIGWVREGDQAHDGSVTLISNADDSR